MKLIRTQPVYYTNPFAEMDRFFDAAFARADVPSRNGRSPVAAPKADIYADDENYHLRVELPGVKKEELKLETRDGRLVIEAQREVDEQAAEDGFRYRREFRLPEDIEIARISAKLEHGLLHVTLPKAAEGGNRTIEIN